MVLRLVDSGRSTRHIEAILVFPVARSLVHPQGRQQIEGQWCRPGVGKVLRSGEAVTIRGFLSCAELID
jgi:hypothetical protein